MESAADHGLERAVAPSLNDTTKSKVNLFLCPVHTGTAGCRRRARQKISNNARSDRQAGRAYRVDLAEGKAAVVQVLLGDVVSLHPDTMSAALYTEK